MRIVQFAFLPHQELRSLTRLHRVLRNALGRQRIGEIGHQDIGHLGLRCWHGLRSCVPNENLLGYCAEGGCNVNGGHSQLGEHGILGRVKWPLSRVKSPF